MIVDTKDIHILIDDIRLEGKLGIPENAVGLVLFAHGSGSSRFSPRNNQVANYLMENGIATLLFDLLTADEDVIDQQTREFRFDIPLLADRLVGATDWVVKQDELKDFKIGYFGSSTGAAAALIGAAKRPDLVSAVVSRGGRPDLAGEFLPLVKAPTLLIVGGLDRTVIELNEDAQSQMTAKTQLDIVPGATHLFEERGTLEKVMELAASWFNNHFK